MNACWLTHFIMSLAVVNSNTGVSLESSIFFDSHCDITFSSQSEYLVLNLLDSALKAPLSTESVSLE